MPEIYHLAHEALLAFAAALFGIPSLVCLDDSITGSIWNREGDPSKKFVGMVHGDFVMAKFPGRVHDLR